MFVGQCGWHLFMCCFAAALAAIKSVYSVAKLPGDKLGLNQHYIRPHTQLKVFS